jgi:chemotaxis protein CheD
MKDTIDVHTGQVEAASGKTVLRAPALGSCVAVVAYDSVRKNGAVAHIMLPGKAPDKAESGEKTKYAADAIEELINKMTVMGSAKEDLKVVVVGGANVLKSPDDRIAEANVTSNLKVLNDHRLSIVARKLGGTERRSVSIDLEKGIITYAHGDSRDEQLWKG